MQLANVRTLAGVLVLAIIGAGDAFADQAGYERLGRQLAEAGIAIKQATQQGKISPEQAAADWRERREALFAAALEAGEITADEAVVMRAEVRKAEQHEQNKATVWQQIGALGQEVQSAVASGEMTEEEARPHWQTRKEEIFSTALESGEISKGEAGEMLHQRSRAELNYRLGATGQKLMAAVANGEMTGEESWQAWLEAKNQLIADAVASGDISRFEAETVHHEMFKIELGQHLKLAGEGIKAAVAKGDMTEEEGQTAWQTAKNDMISSAVESGDLSLAEADEFLDFIEKAEVGERLKAAVANGEMSEEDAWAEWERLSQEWAADAANTEGYAAKAKQSEPDDPWARYTRAFIAKHDLNEQQQERAWQSYKELRQRAAKVVRRLDKPSAGAQPDEKQKAAQAAIAHELDRMFEQLKSCLDSLLTREQRAKAKQ